MISFTPAQQNAVDHKKGNLVVSASAGTGKTTVLTERIINIIKDRENDCDIDEMLIMTFTRAAAGEMRTRTLKKLNDLLSTRPTDEHILRQIALVPHATISTINSFCCNIVRDYFYIINVDPGFRIADEQEMVLLQDEVLDALLEKYYEAQSESFVRMMNMLIPGRNTDDIKEYIIKLYTVAQSHPDIMGWLNEIRKTYEINNPEELDNATWMQESDLIFHTKAMAKQADSNYAKILECISEYTELSKLADFIAEERLMVSALLNKNTFSELGRVLFEIKDGFKRFTSPKSLEEDAKEARDRAKSLRDDSKSIILSLCKDYYYKSPEEICDEILRCRPVVNELIDITIDFINELTKEKRARNIAEFSDIEHMALDILSVPDSYAAKDLRERFKYILVDEYQDINEVQDSIIRMLSRESYNEPNIFMVGDVKQSIYGFRLAKPEIFEEKRKAYSDEESMYQRIMLKNNYRSDTAILRFVNELFADIMKESLGKVEYDEAHHFAIENDDEEGEKPEIMVILKEDADISEMGKRKVEGAAIADKINELVDSGVAKYGDFAILFRSMKGWAEEISEVLRSKGIPVVTEERTGYFAAKEIMIITSLLGIIDNPHQDILLAAVMKSVYGGFNIDEIARVKACKKKSDLYEAVKHFIEKEENTELSDKCKAFVNKLEALRKEAVYISVYDLLWKLYQMDDFIYHMGILPMGERRLGNLRMLTRIALDFEKTERRSLYDFLQYINKMKKASIDFGEAGVSDSDDSAVKIMSIHNSKGLEFPYVFVSGMGKYFNKMDARKAVVINSTLGVGIDYINLDDRVKYKTLVKKAMSRKIVTENLGEELRVLYVALTRPKKKLILTGLLKDQEELGKMLEKEPGDYASMVKALTAFDWILPCVDPNLIDVHFASEYVVEEERVVKNQVLIRKELLKCTTSSVVIDENVQKEIKEIKDFVYPFEKEVSLAGKVSVTEIKKRKKDANNAIFEEIPALVAPWAKDDEPEYVPAFIKADKEDAELSGAEKGTIYHSVMEHIKVNEIHSLEDARSYVEKLMGDGIIPDHVLTHNIIDCKKIVAFCQSDLGKRMGAAQVRGEFYAEQPFVMGISASEVYPGIESDETILIQGIIDAFFIEDGEIVLLDYKTDKVSRNDGDDILKERYSIQLDLYTKAIEKTMPEKVKQKSIYSIFLDKEIIL